MCPELTNNFVSLYESMCTDSSDIRKTLTEIMKSKGYGRNALTNMALAMQPYVGMSKW